LDRALEQHGKSGQRVAVIAIDIDQLKEINEAHGHAAGDEMLKRISRLMTAELREGEFVARVGGDEFAAIKTFADQDALLRFAARLETALSAEHAIAGSKLSPGGYLGVAVFPTDANTKDELVNRADMALHRAMEQASLPVHFYEADIEEAARHRRRLIEDLKYAIERNELALVYQAQFSVKTSALTGYEALLRWHHPERGPIPPSEFIPLAEESGLIVDIGDWVLRTACREARGWPNGIKVAVNLSPVQLSVSDLAERIHDILLETGLPPQNLEIEITESAIIADTAKAREIVTQLKKMRVAIALDDFGVGYSSMDTLNTFSFDKIKLDRSFVAEVGQSPQAVVIIRAIIALGHALDIPVLAEGIETDLQFQLLKAEQCDEAQGYLLGRPKSAEELTRERALQVG
jgi:diguanylate cyclase (GGDEF)-like protein